MDASRSPLSLTTRIEFSIANVRQLNAWFVELLMAPSGAGFPPATTLAQLPLSSGARRRLCEFPFLLSNLSFEDPAFWRECRVGALATETDGQPALFPVSATIAFARSLSIVAWQMAHDPGSPRFLMGMTNSVATLIDGMTFKQLDWVVIHRGNSLRPRWSNVEGFWTRLLRSAQAADEQAWSDFQLHALRMLGRDLLIRDSHSDRSGRRPASL